jgi:hypothetical protein
MHYYQWVYQVDVPISNQLIKVIKMKKMIFLQLFLVVLSFAAVAVGLK